MKTAFVDDGIRLALEVLQLMKMVPFLFVIVTIQSSLAAPARWLDASGCEAECTTAGHCCQGLGSACQKPSCAMVRLIV